MSQGFQRFGIALFGLVAIGMGVAPLLRGETSFESWPRSGLVFAPLILGLGILVLLASIFNWHKLLLDPDVRRRREHRKHSRLNTKY